MGRPRTAPNLIAHKEIPTDTFGYAVHLTVFDDGTMTIGVGSAKRRQQAILTREQADRLLNLLQSLKTMM